MRGEESINNLPPENGMATPNIPSIISPNRRIEDRQDGCLSTPSFQKGVTSSIPPNKILLIIAATISFFFITNIIAAIKKERNRITFSLDIKEDTMKEIFVNILFKFQKIKDTLIQFIKRKKLTRPLLKISQFSITSST